MTELLNCHVCTKPFYWRFNAKPVCLKHYQQLHLFQATINFMKLSFQAPTLHQAQRFVKGYIEVVNLGDQGQLLVNEEFLLVDFPVLNANATALSLEYAGCQSPIFGAALHLTGPALWT